MFPARGYHDDIDKHYPSVQHHYNVAYDLYQHDYFDHRAAHDDLHRAAYNYVYDLDHPRSDDIDQHSAPDHDEQHDDEHSGDQHSGDHSGTDDYHDDGPRGHYVNVPPTLVNDYKLVFYDEYEHDTA
jgi:hypothetical protein